MVLLDASVRSSVVMMMRRVCGGIGETTRGLQGTVVVERRLAWVTLLEGKATCSIEIDDVTLTWTFFYVIVDLGRMPRQLVDPPRGLLVSLLRLACLPAWLRLLGDFLWGRSL